MTTNRGSTTLRNVPDVALTARQYFHRRRQQATENVGGTSAASPLWAGFIALVNQQARSRPAVHRRALSTPRFTLSAKARAYTSAFHDITTGDNTWPGFTPSFMRFAGYDLGTGWGTPNGDEPDHRAGRVTTDSLGISPLTGAAFGGVVSAGRSIRVRPEFAVDQFRRRGPQLVAHQHLRVA